MRVIKGQLKLQYDIFYVHEMLEFKSVNFDFPADVADVVGYAVFNLQHQRLGRFCQFYGEIIDEIERLSKNTQTQESLLAA